MSSGLKHWQIKIWVGSNVDQPITVYGDSLASVRAAAAEWLRENKPEDFGNAPPSSEFYRRVNYFYSDGTRQPIFPLKKYYAGRTLEEGWYYVGGDLPELGAIELKNFDKVIDHFVKSASIIEKGPDYQDIPLMEGNFPLHLIRTVRREMEVLQVNDLLQRGWYILALEIDNRREPQFGGKDETSFVLGHPEENAL